MKSPRTLSKIRFLAVAVIGAALVAACGGGGGSSGSSGSTSPNTSSNTSQPATLLQAAASPQTVAASGDATANGVAFMNAVRLNVGYPSTLTVDSTLTTVSKDHTVYLVDNQATGHNETQGLPGYTGDTPYTRGLTVNGEVVVAGSPLSFPTTLSPVQIIFDAPFHRVLMLDNFGSMGVASTTGASWEAFNIDFGGSTSAVTDSQLIAYPYPGQKDAPTSWYASESPNPFAAQPQYENTNVGYPTTIQGTMSAKLSSVSIKLTDSGGNDVACLLQTADNDTDLSNGAMCIPFAPLKAGSTYTAHATGVLTATSGTHPVDVTWPFTTAQAPAASEIPSGAVQQHAVPQ